MLSQLTDTDEAEPSPDLTAPQQALWWIRKGDFQLGDGWHKAHEICQGAEGSREYDLIHALVHLIEGDHANAAYWYRRAGEEQISADPKEEWAHIAGRLTHK